MAWRTLTTADVLGVLSVPETLLLDTIDGEAGQSVLTDLFATVVNHCRGYIADNKANALASGLTLPERVIRPALHLLRLDLLTRLDCEISEDRRKSASEAIRFFERVSDGKISIEPPNGNLEAPATGAGISLISTHERLATRQNLSRL